jgi:hypothetical protein
LVIVTLPLVALSTASPNAFFSASSVISTGGSAGKSSSNVPNELMEASLGSTLPVNVPRYLVSKEYSLVD